MVAQGIPAREEVSGSPRADRVARANARWYFAGLAASLIGNSAMSLVAGIWVKSLTGSSEQAGLVGGCVYAATLLAPFAGLLADRLPRRPLLLCLNLIAAATVALLLLVRSRGEVWLIFVVMAAYGVQATLMDPAEDALFAQMFTTEFRRRINGWRLTIQETGRLASPLLGAGLFVLLGGGAVAALDGATFVVAAFVVTRLRVDESGVATVVRPGRPPCVPGSPTSRAHPACGRWPSQPRSSWPSRAPASPLSTASYTASVSVRRSWACCPPCSARARSSPPSRPAG